MIERLVWILANPWYKYIFLTFAATILSIVVRALSSQKNRIEMEDWAVGHDLAQVAMFTLLGDGVAEVINDIVVKHAQTIPADVVARAVLLGPILFFMFVFLLCSVLFVRLRGWIPVSAAAPCPHLNKKGIFAPLPLGLLYLAVVMVYMGGH